jgi:hypothetical protein
MMSAATVRLETSAENTRPVRPSSPLRAGMLASRFSVWLVRWWNRSLSSRMLAERRGRLAR